MSLIVFFYANIILLCMALGPVFIKKASFVLTPLQITFTTSVVLVLTSGILLASQGNLLPIKKVFHEDHQVIGFVLIAGLLFFFDMVSYGAALRAGANLGVLMGYVRVGGTVFTALLGIMIFGDKLSPIQWGGMIMSCVGLALLLNGDNISKLVTSVQAVE